MEIICCVILGKHAKFKNAKISYIFEKILVLSIICSRCENKDEKELKKRINFDTKISWFN